MKGIFARTALLALGLFLAAEAAGQDITFGLKFGLTVDDSNYSNLPFEPVKDVGTTYGFRLGVREGHFGLETGYFYAGRSLTPIPEAPPELGDTEFKLSIFSVNALYFPFPEATLQPYLTGGYGYYRVNFVEYDEDSSSGLNLGAGLNLLLLRHVSLSLEARHHWVSFTLAEELLELRTWTANFNVNYHF
jgi:hypothetical protein